MNATAHPPTASLLAARGEIGRAREPLVVRLLGPVEVQVGDRTISAPQWKYARGRDLLLYLILAGRASRGKLGEIFWPGADAEHQRNSMNVCLYWLRKGLGDASWVQYRAGAYEVDAEGELRCDLHAFEQLLALADCAHAQPAQQAAHLEAALALVRGPVLEDVVDGNWHQAPRAKAQRMIDEARLRLGSLHLAGGDPRSAARSFARLLQDDPLCEAGAQGLMRAHAATGALAELVHTYQALHAALNEELGVSPTAQTRKLYAQLVEELGGYTP